MKNDNFSAPVSYLVLKKFHIVPIKELEPACIKAAAKKAKCDREKIKYNTLLNAIAKGLGVKGGFSEYQRVYDSVLTPFLNKHGMNKRVDLLKQRLKGFDIDLTEFSHQDLSERFFYSERDLPQKVFTGYNFDFKHTIDDGYDYFNRVLCEHGDEGPMGLKNSNGFNIPISVKKDIVENNVKVARANPSLILDCKIEKKPLINIFDIDSIKKDEPDSKAIQAGIEHYNCFANRSMLDIVVGSFMKDLGLSFNLLGDSLVKPVQHTNEVELYLGNTDIEALNEEKDLVITQFELFRERIEQSEDGWIDVIPFNDNLIFLRGGNGQYDFVFKNQRNKIFEHQVFGQSLKRADIPSCVSDYQFRRWYYFECQGWRQMDAHCAENYFYEKGNRTSSYPGRSAVIQNYYESRGCFIPKKLQSDEKLNNFKEVKLGGKSLMISQLISIGDLKRFAVLRSDYMEYRVGDDLSSVNNEEDLTLPASVTWFDAIAYLNWLEEHTKVPVRLLTVNEYELLREEENISKKRNPIVLDLKFINTDGRVFSQHPPYMSESEFQALTLKFGNLEKHIGISGLEFMRSNCFAEWLMEETCIRSGNLKSFYNDDLIIRSRPPRNSTGKYKGVKIGFRVCYELEE